MDDGKLSVDERKNLINEVIGIVGSAIVSNIFATSMKGQPLVTLFKKIKTESEGKGLEGGFRITAKLASKAEVVFNYFGLHSNGSVVILSDLKMKAGNNSAEIKSGSLEFNLIVHENVTRIGVKGVGTKMFDLGFKAFEGKFDTIKALWVVNKELYKKGMSDNLRKFIDAKKEGLSDEDAAKKTWTYSMSAKKGYDRVVYVGVTQGGPEDFSDVYTGVPPYPENIIRVDAEFALSGITVSY